MREKRVTDMRRGHATASEPQKTNPPLAAAARRLTAPLSGGQSQVLAVDARVVLLAAGGEGHLRAAHLAGDGDVLAFRMQRAGEHLEFLLEGELALRQLVGAGDLGGHDPEERGA